MESRSRDDSSRSSDAPALWLAARWGQCGPAETLGSVGSHYLVADQNKAAVGVEVNANHVRSVRSGWVYGVANLSIKGKMHVWSIDIRDEQERLVCTSRLTVMIINKPNQG